MICNTRNLDKTENEFYKGRKYCKICYYSRRKCDHNKRKDRCKDCDGFQLCHHKTLKYSCKNAKNYKNLLNVINLNY